MKKYVPLFEEFSEQENGRLSGNTLQPKNKKELQDMIVKAIEEKGPEVDLNYIDVSGIDDMRDLFYIFFADRSKDKILWSFNGDISEWDVSRVTNMNHMFCRAENFNGDISGWDVSNVNDMNSMFCRAENFNGDISGWDVSNVVTMEKMFYQARSFNQDISGWDVSNVRFFDYIFSRCLIEEEFKPKKFQFDMKDFMDLLRFEKDENTKAEIMELFKNLKNKQ